MSEPISERLRDVICAELGLESYPLNMDTLATQVPGWDSLAHVRVLVAVEEAFGIRIKSMEAIRLRNVGDLQQLVLKKSTT
jgi:acyl carrier protein